MPNPISTRESEQRLAFKIEAYWGRRGYRVQTWLEPYSRQPIPEPRTDCTESTSEYIGFVVRSDLVNGLPKEMFDAKKVPANVR